MKSSTNLEIVSSQCYDVEHQCGDVDGEKRAKDPPAQPNPDSHRPLAGLGDGGVPHEVLGQVLPPQVQNGARRQLHEDRRVEAEVEEAALAVEGVPRQLEVADEVDCKKIPSDCKK